MKKSRIILCVLVMLCCACEEVAPPELPVISVSVSDITTNSAVITATASPKGATQTTGVLYGMDANLQSQEATSALTSLTSNTTYYYKGYAADKLNNRIYSDVKSFKTLEETLNVSTTSIAAKVEAGSYTFDITGNTSWTVSSNQTWCTAQPTSGSGNGTVTLTITGNTSVSSRTATITVKSGTISRQVTLAQGEAILNVSTTSIPAQAAAGSYNFNISSNVSWTVQSDQTWCTAQPVSGSGNSAITLTITANTSVSSRTATITVTSGSISKQVTLEQAGVTPILNVSTTSITAQAEADSYIYNITSNTSWTVQSNQSWCSLQPTSGSGNATVTIAVSDNVSTSGRTATLTVSGSSITKTVTVTQQANSIEFGNGITAAANFGGGNGTQNNPYLISTPRQLKKLVNDVRNENAYTGIYFKLNTDIHVTAYEWIPIGGGTGPFCGNFDGGGHTISGTLKSSYERYFGFFGYIGYIYASTISNLTIAATVQNNSVESEATGGVAGSSFGGIITNCTVSGTVKGTNNVGGIVGDARGYNYANPPSHSYIKNCIVSGTVTGASPVGGIVGMNSGYIENCTNRSVLQGEGAVGGLAGTNWGGVIHTSLNTGNISGGNVGGLVEYNDEESRGHVYSCNTNTGLVNGQPANTGNQIRAGRGVESCPDGHAKR